MYKDYAFIIGINDYTPLEEDGLISLNAAINDAMDFEHWFLHESGGGSKERCKSVYSTRNPLKPHQEEIDKQLTALLLEAKKDPEQNRRLYFYFSGHGSGVDFDPTINALCLANWSGMNRNEALSSKEYHDLIINFGLFRQVVIFLDCCRDIKKYVVPRNPRINTVPAAGKHRAEVFWGYAAHYSYKGYEIATETGERRGIFTSVLMKGLRGAAANEEGIINSASLKRYLDKQIPAEASKIELKQKPEINDGLTEPDSVFGRVPAGLLVDCVIRIDENRGRPIHLVNGSGNVIKKILDGETEVKVSLTKGLYLVKDISNNKHISIEIETRINNKEPDLIVVNF